MKQALILICAALTAGCMVEEEPARLTASDSDRLAEALAGRSAGPAVDCVNQRELRGNRSIGDGVILFTAARGIVYVNRPGAGCPGLEFGNSLRTRTPTDRLCRGDIVTVFDPVSGFEMGGCGLGEFVPYRRAG